MLPGGRLFARSSFRTDEPELYRGFGKADFSTPRNLPEGATDPSDLQRMGIDHHPVAQKRGRELADIHFRDGVEPFPGLQRRPLVDAQHVEQIGARALEPADVVGMIDHPACVGVLVEHAKRIAVKRSVKDAAGGKRVAAHAAGCVAGGGRSAIRSSHLSGARGRKDG